MPSSVRATWSITFVTPCPTSAAAQNTSAEPSSNRPHARGAVVVEALREADVLEADREADAAPDALAARRVAGAAGQPERVARQLASGSGSSAARRITSATGSEPVIGWPVGSVSPGAIAFSSRSSTGSIPSATASLSICASPAKHVCTAPNPRIAPHGGLFV